MTQFIATTLANVQHAGTRPNPASQFAMPVAVLPARARRGFTLVELLVAMALIVLIMSVVSQAFVEGLESFRHLKSVGDLAERLRESAVALAADIDSTNLEAREFIEKGLITRTVDRAEAAALAERYKTICQNAEELQGQFLAIKTDRREVLQAIEREIAALEKIKLSAKLMVELLQLVSPPPTPDS